MLCCECDGGIRSGQGGQGATTNDDGGTCTADSDCTSGICNAQMCAAANSGGTASTCFDGYCLGQGAAGCVYEAFHSATSKTVALKILNPIGFKLLPSGSLHRYIVAKKGEPRDNVTTPWHRL